MRHSNYLAVVIAALLSPGVGAQTTNNNATNANSNSSSGSASNSTSYGNVGNSTTNYIAPTSGANAGANSSSSTTSNSNASNAGNSQTIIFNTQPPGNGNGNAASTQRQILGGGTNSTLTTNGTQTVNQNLSGTTTSNQNVTSQSHISGEQTIRYEYGDQTIKNTPSVGGPPLTTSNDTCMGSSSGSVNVPGFGVGLGSTWTDRNCVMLKNAREMWNMGMKAAALALFCTDDNNRMALEITGFVCPQTQLARQQAAAAAEAARVASAQEQARREQRRAFRIVRDEPSVPPALPLELMPPLQATGRQRCRL